MRFSILCFLATAASFVAALPATSSSESSGGAVAALDHNERDLESSALQPNIERRGVVQEPEILDEKLEAFKKAIPPGDEWAYVKALAIKVSRMIDGPIFRAKAEFVQLSGHTRKEIEAQKLGETSEVVKTFKDLETAFGFDV